MVESLLKFVTSQGLFSHDDKILLAVSGGVDSMVMAQLFLNAGIHFSIAHVNYNLRGKHSIGDREFVRKWGQAHDVMVHVREVTSDEYDPLGSIQIRAREIRYDFFEGLIHESGYTKVATAHHINDAFETVMLNLVRGSGPRGLKGIPIKRDRVIRPMMFASRADIMDYAQTYNIKWREDASNAKIDYHRNFIRKEIAPRLKELNPALENTFRDTLLRLEATSELVMGRKAEILRKHSKESNGVRMLATSWLEDNKIGLLLLSEILSDYGLNFKVTKDVHRCILDGEVGKLFYGTSVVVNLDREQLIITPDLDGAVAVDVTPDQSEVAIGQRTLHLERLHQEWKLCNDENVGMLDYDLLKWPLKLRTWRQGDRFAPMGMKGTKLVSDFLIDQKVPLALKNDVLVLESTGDICWVVGYRISDKFKVTSQSSSVYKISINHA